LNGERPRAAVVVGNPKPSSRTLTVAESLARNVLGTAGEIDVIELAPLGGSLFSWGNAEVAAAKKTVLDSDLLVVASPVYKASYTGLLKAFLDQFGRDELDALPTVPVMVGAGAAHALAVETQLRPVLVEIGASCPTRGVYVLESELESLSFDDWLAVWGDGLRTLIAARGEKPRIH
jgi:FMN reductase